MPERLPPKPATSAGQFDLFGKRANGPRVYSVSELTRELKAGEVVIVTLFFEKSGALGVVSSVE